MVLLTGVAEIAKADFFYESTTGAPLKASANFAVSGNNLIVTLTNTSSADVLVPANILTALFFDVVGVGALTPVSAVLGAGSSVVYDPDGQPVGGVVGGEWAYGSGLAGAPRGATEGISSAGFGLFGNANFNGPDLSSPSAVNGMNYGILSFGDNFATDNGGIINAEGEIWYSVVFTLSGLPNNFVPSAATITGINFQYGTALTEPNIDGGGGEAPEPISLILLGSGLAGVGLYRRFRKSK